MKIEKKYQNKFGKEGNCFAACIATITGISLESIPTFLEPKGEWYQKYKEWIQTKGFDMVALTDWTEESKEFAPKVYSIVSGKGPRGLDHSVVYYHLDMFHDPHPEGGGVTDIMDWIYIVPIQYDLTAYYASEVEKLRRDYEEDLRKKDKCEHEGCEETDIIRACHTHINTNYPCIECEQKDERIKELTEEVSLLKKLGHPQWALDKIKRLEEENARLKENNAEYRVRMLYTEEQLKRGER